MGKAVIISLERRQALMASITDYLKDTGKEHWTGDQVDALVDLCVASYAIGVRQGREDKEQHLG